MREVKPPMVAHLATLGNPESIPLSENFPEITKKYSRIRNDGKRKTFIGRANC